MLLQDEHHERSQDSGKDAPSSEAENNLRADDGRVGGRPRTAAEADHETERNRKEAHASDDAGVVFSWPHTVLLEANVQGLEVTNIAHDKAEADSHQDTCERVDIGDAGG
jgi:hypothetical protein